MILCIWGIESFIFLHTLFLNCNIFSIFSLSTQCENTTWNTKFWNAYFKILIWTPGLPLLLIPFCLWFHSSSNVAVIYLRRARVIESDSEGKKSHSPIFKVYYCVSKSTNFYCTIFLFYIGLCVHFY